MASLKLNLFILVTNLFVQLEWLVCVCVSRH